MAITRLHVAGATFDLVDDEDETKDYIDATIDSDLNSVAAGRAPALWTAFETTDGTVHVRLHPGIDIAVSSTS